MVRGYDNFFCFLEKDFYRGDELDLEALIHRHKVTGIKLIG